MLPPLFLLETAGCTATSDGEDEGLPVRTPSVLLAVGPDDVRTAVVAARVGVAVRVLVGSGGRLWVGVGSTVGVGLGVGEALGVSVGHSGMTQGAASAAVGRARSSTADAPAPASTLPTRIRIARGYERFSGLSANLAHGSSVVTRMRVAQTAAGGWQDVTELASNARRADDLLTALYTAHYRDLVRLAAFLTSDRDNAEEVVQDAYVKVHGSWFGLRDPDKAEAYLRTAVVNGARSRLRRRQVVAKHRPEPLLDVASAETFALQTSRRDAVVTAVRQLPQRQREVVSWCLRYFGDLSEAQTAAAMGCSVGAVKSHTSRAMASLRPLLVDER